MTTAAAGAQVADLIDQLKIKALDIENRIQADQEAKAAVERNLVKFTDELEELDIVLQKQRKLLKKYNNALDEAEQAIQALAKSAEKFSGQFGRIAKEDQVPDGLM